VALVLGPNDGFLLAIASGEQSVDEALQIRRDMLDSAAPARAAEDSVRLPRPQG
jgi:hypothetical protein